MVDKLLSRKLGILIGLVALVICNYYFRLGMPPDDILYLVVLGVSYILGQGYVDAKKQPVQDFPVDAMAQSVMNLVKAEQIKLGFGNNVPMEKIIEAFGLFMKQGGYGNREGTVDPNLTPSQK